MPDESAPPTPVYSTYFQTLYADLYHREDTRSNQQMARQPFTVATSTVLLSGVGFLWRELGSSHIHGCLGLAAKWICFGTSLIAAVLLIIGVTCLVRGLWPKKLSPPLTAKHIHEHSATYRTNYLAKIPELPDQAESRLEEEIQQWLADQFRIGAMELAERNNVRGLRFSEATTCLAIASLVLLVAFGSLQAVYALRDPPASINVTIPALPAAPPPSGTVR